jgi:RHS repeat-associated protein
MSRSRRAVALVRSVQAWLISNQSSIMLPAKIECLESRRLFSTPTLSASSVPGSGTVDLVWTYGGTDEAGFEIEMKDEQRAGDNFHTIDTPGPASSGTWSESGLDNWGDTYAFRIRADLINGTVSNYAETAITPTPASGPSPGLPAPTIEGVSTGINTEGIDYANINLSSSIDFTAATYQTNGILDRVGDPYEVLFFYGPSFDGFAGDENSSSVYFGGATGATYTVKEGVIETYPDSDGSPVSNTYEFTLPGTLPAAPVISASLPDADGNITVSWPTPDDSNDVALYGISGDSAPGGATLLGTTTGSSMVINEAGHYTSMFAVNETDNGDSDYSNILPIQPAAPYSLTAVEAANSKQVNLYWENTPNNEASFTVQRGFKAPEGYDGTPPADSDGYVWETITSTAADVTSTTDDLNLVPGQTYYYRVYASNAAGNSGYSNVVTVPFIRQCPTSGGTIDASGDNQTDTPGLTSHTSDWTESASLDNSGTDDSESYLMPLDGSTDHLTIVDGRDDQSYFDTSGSNYVEAYGGTDALTHSGDQYILTEPSGEKLAFADSFQFGDAGPQSKLVSMTDPGGNLSNVASTNSAGNPTEVDITTAGDITTEKWLYTYVTSGVNTGMLSSVEQEMNHSGSFEAYRWLTYTYYDGTTALGMAGNIASAVITDADGNTIQQSHYIYYTNGEAGGTPGALEFELDDASYARLIAAYPGDGLETLLADNDIAPFADTYLTYNDENQVATRTLQRAGSSALTGGLGTYTYTYADSGNTPGVNNWSTKTTETVPGGDEYVTYYNSNGQTMLSVYEDETTGLMEGTFTEYDDSGRAILTANPSAVNLPSSLSTIEAYPDLLNNVSGNYEYLNDSTGLINLTDYASSTTATSSMAGNVAGYEEDTEIEQGQTGTPILQSSEDYIVHGDDDGDTIYPIADSTVYRNTNGTGEETTSYTYTWYSNSLQPKSMATRLPVISASQNGPGTADVITDVYDQFGRVIWEKDANGYISCTAYDTNTGGVIKSIQDVNTSDTSDFESSTLPSGWTTPTGGGLELITTYEVDDQGRAIEQTDPDGNVTYIVYNDALNTSTGFSNEVRTYPGWHEIGSTGNYTTTGPVQVTRMNDPGSYSETLTYAAPSISSAMPDGTDAIGTIESLSRSLTSAGGQVVETDKYFDLTGVTYSASSFHLGTSETNYYATLYGYDADGNLNKVVAPTGTITRTVYDGQSRPISVWIGTNDTPTSGYWSPTNPAGMTEVSQNIYDNGGAGDSNITQSIEYPGGGQLPRVTMKYYDWRDRLVATKSGVLLNTDGTEDLADEADGTNRPIAYTTYDNLDETIEQQTYDGDGVAVTTTDGVPDAPSSALLVADSTAAYDDRGRVYQSEIVSVDPTTGSEGDALVTNNYYDADGNLIATISPTGTATKYTYNGADWNTFKYVTDGGQLNNFSNVAIGSDTAYSAAASVDGDVVLTQTQNIYDRDGNIIETITRDRFGTDPTTSTGALGTPNTGVKARVSYTASYFDAAGRDVADINAGTFGGTAYTLRVVTSASAGSTTALTDFSGSSSYIGDVIAIITGTGAGERATITGYNSSTHNFSFGALATAPAGDSKFIIVDPISMLTQTEYDAAGWVQSSIDPKGIDTQSSYDLLGRTIQTIADYTDGTPTDSSNQTTDYTYDGDNNVLTMTAVMPSGETSQVTYYVYGVNTDQGSSIDDNDLLYQVEYPDPTSGTNTSTGTYNQAETYTYDAIGEQTGYSDRNGNIHAYTYDQLGRLTTDLITNFGAGVDETVAELGYSYTDAGQLSTVSSYSADDLEDPINQVEYTYDGFGQMTSDGQGTGTVEYAYDPANDDRLTSITYPDGRVINYNYDGSSGLDSVLSRINSVSDSSGSLQSYSYLGLDTPVTFTDGNGVELSFLGTVGSTGGDAGDQYTGLDRFGRVIDQNWNTASTGAGIDQSQYGYDADSNVTYMDNVTNTSSGTINSTLAGESQLYTYDNLNRLTTFSSGALSISGETASISGTPASTEGWSLDALGNWVSSSSDGVTTDRSNSNQNQITSVGTGTLDYDANGNTTTDQNGQTYVYDAWNRLVSVTTPGSDTVTYSYDGLGRRISEADSDTGITTNLFYSTSDQVIEEQQSGTTTTQYVWSPFYVDQMIERDSVRTLGAFEGTLSFADGITPLAATVAGNGRTVVLADDSNDDGPSATVLVWYNADGTIDTALGTDGYVALPVNFYEYTYASVYVDADNQILISDDSKIIELNPDFSQNTSFGTDGEVDFPSSTPSLVACNLNGTFVAASITDDPYGYDPYGELGLTKYNAAGDETGSADTGVYMSPQQIAINASGEIAVAGSDNYSGTDGEPGVAVAGFTSSLSCIFSTTDDSYYGGATAVAVDTAGNVLVAGDELVDDLLTSKLEKYNSSGAEVSAELVSSFAYVSSMTTLSNGKILLAGLTSSTSSFGLSCLNSDGTVDTEFGDDGVSTTGALGYMVSSLAISPIDGSVVVMSATTTGSFSGAAQRFYVEQSANYNVTSITDSSGNVVERYEYDPYGNVTVLNPDGTTRGDGTIASSNYSWIYTFQGGRLDPTTGLVHFDARDYDPETGQWMTEDPAGYVNSADTYQFECGGPNDNLDPIGTQIGMVYELPTNGCDG